MKTLTNQLVWHWTEHHSQVFQKKKMIYHNLIINYLGNPGYNTGSRNVKRKSDGEQTSPLIEIISRGFDNYYNLACLLDSPPLAKSFREYRT